MTARVQTVWSSCLERISDVIPKYSYNTWIRPLRPISLEDRDPQILRVEVPNVFHQKWVEENYIDIVGKSVREILGPQTMLQLSLPLDLEYDGDASHSRLPSVDQIPSRRLCFLGKLPSSCGVRIDVGGVGDCVDVDDGVTDETSWVHNDALSSKRQEQVS